MGVKYMKNIIFYFSGTGNSLEISNLIADKLGETEVECITNMPSPKEYLASYERIGFVIPVYYAHAPAIVLNILKDKKFSKNQRVFFVATFAGSYGYALTDLREAINKNNAVVAQEFCIRMPGNYIVEYGAFPKFLQNIILRSATKKAIKVAEAILINKPTSELKPNFIVKLASPKTIQTKLESFKNMGLEFHINGNCTKCGVCERLCPVQNIVVSDTEVVWSNKCEQCMACIQWCPSQAIEFSNKTQHRNRYHNPMITFDQLNRKA
jgi:ferredoxin